MSSKEAESIAANIGNFSNFIWELPLGSKADNMEMAIAGYKEAATIFTRVANLYQWAKTQHNLGAAYSDRIMEDKAQNLERAIAYYKAALKVHTRDANPKDWARTQNNLGMAYCVRGQIPEAIACFRSALEIRTPEAFPINCLRTGRNLGNTAFVAGMWSEAIEGYERAIAAVEISRSWASSDRRRR